MNRTGKQISFGSIYLLFFILIASGIYFFYLKPVPSCSDNKQNQKETGVDCGGPCIPCEVKDLNLAHEVYVFPAGGDEVTLLAKVSNPSENFVATFAYEFRLQGAIFGSWQLRGQASIASRTTEYVVVPGVSVTPKDAANISFNINELNWSEVRTPPPDIVTVKETRIDGLKITVTGTLSNRSASNLGLINLTAILFDKEGKPLNASLTRLERVAAFSQKSFIIFFPEVEGLTERADPEKTKIQWDLDE